MANTSNYIVPPVSRKELRDYAASIRLMLKINGPFFPIVELLEIMWNLVNVDYDVVGDDEWGQTFDDQAHALYDMNTRTISVRESVYNGALNGVGRDRFTIAHEIAHALLLSDNKSMVYRTSSSDNYRCYTDPEWQADCLAGELLIPYELCKGMSIKEIMVACGVSEDAARCQKNKYIKAI